MLTQDLKNFIDLQFDRLKKYYDCHDKKIFKLAATVKLSEELGELCCEILASENLRRKEKVQNHNKESLEQEFADVLITTLILAKANNVNIEKSLKEKIKSIDKIFSNITK